MGDLQDYFVWEHENKNVICCGECEAFLYEDTDGIGWCDKKNKQKYCGCKCELKIKKEIVCGN